MVRSGVTASPSEAEPEMAAASGLSAWEVDDALASEYVLGLLDDTEAAEAERRLQTDATFAGMVAHWQALMADEGVAPAVLGQEPDPSVVAEPSPQDPPAAPAPVAMAGKQAVGATRTRRPMSIGRAIYTVLRFFSGMAVAALMVLATVAFVAHPRPSVIALLAAPDNRLSYEIAEFGSALKVTRLTGSGALGDMVHQLWLIIPGEGETSLGLLEDPVMVIDTPRPPRGARLAVSLEHAGGSPMVEPSGPIIMMSEVTE